MYKCAKNVVLECVRVERKKIGVMIRLTDINRPNEPLAIELDFEETAKFIDYLNDVKIIEPKTKKRNDWAAARKIIKKIAKENIIPITTMYDPVRNRHTRKLRYQAINQIRSDLGLANPIIADIMECSEATVCTALGSR